jgi:hypothetical protein
VNATNHKKENPAEENPGRRRRFVEGVEEDPVEEDPLSNRLI